MTQKQKENAARDHYRQYLMSTKDSLAKAYGSWSVRKQAAWDHCREVCREMDGHGLKVITFNTDKFTAGFESVDGMGVCQFTYMTPSFEITIEITPDMI